MFMKRIILDTNFLTIPVQFNLDIFEEIDRIMEEEYELFTTDGIIQELKKLTESKGKDAVAARIGLELIKRKHIKIIETKRNDTDKAMVELADKNTIIATNDKLLRKKLKNKNLKSIYLRGKKYLTMG